MAMELGAVEYRWAGREARSETVLQGGLGAGGLGRRGKHGAGQLDALGKVPGRVVVDAGKAVADDARVGSQFCPAHDFFRGFVASGAVVSHPGGDKGLRVVLEAAGELDFESLRENNIGLGVREGPVNDGVAFGGERGEKLPVGAEAQKVFQDRFVGQKVGDQKGRGAVAEFGAWDNGAGVGAGGGQKLGCGCVAEGAGEAQGVGVFKLAGFVGAFDGDAVLEKAPNAVVGAGVEKQGEALVMVAVVCADGKEKGVADVGRFVELLDLGRSVGFEDELGDLGPAVKAGGFEQGGARRVARSRSVGSGIAEGQLRQDNFFAQLLMAEFLDE